MKISKFFSINFWLVAIRVFLFKRSLEKQTRVLAEFFKITVFDLPIDEAARRVNRLRFQISSLSYKDPLSISMINTSYELCNDIDLYLKLKKVVTLKLKT